MSHPGLLVTRRVMVSDHGVTDVISGTAEAAGPTLPKAATGIRGLDEITRGGLPRGRTTLLTGGAGTGKTLLALQFLVAGAREYGEPGVLLTFEESTAKVSANVASLGFDLDGLQRDRLMSSFAATKGYCGTTVHATTSRVGSLPSSTTNHSPPTSPPPKLNSPPQAPPRSPNRSASRSSPHSKAVRPVPGSRPTTARRPPEKVCRQPALPRSALRRTLACQCSRPAAIGPLFPIPAGGHAMSLWMRSTELEGT